MDGSTNSQKAKKPTKEIEAKTDHELLFIIAGRLQQIERHLTRMADIADGVERHNESISTQTQSGHWAVRTTGR